MSVSYSPSFAFDGGIPGGDPGIPGEECTNCIQSADECSDPEDFGCDCLSAMQTCNENHDCDNVLPPNFNELVDGCEGGSGGGDGDTGGSDPMECTNCIQSADECSDPEDFGCDCLSAMKTCNENHDCENVLPPNFNELVDDCESGNGDGDNGDGDGDTGGGDPTECTNCIQSADECSDPEDFGCDCLSAMKSCKDEHDCTNVLPPNFDDLVSDCEDGSGNGDGDGDGDEQGNSSDSGSSGISTGAGFGIALAVVSVGSALGFAAYRFSRNNQRGLVTTSGNSAVGETVNPISMNGNQSMRGAVVSNVYAQRSSA